jgi:hypothetical protein
MIKFIPLAALLAGAALVPQVAFAQTTPSNPTTDANPQPVMVCRAARANEVATATVVATKASMVCRAIDMKAMMAGPAGMKDMKTADDANKAWQTFLNTQFQSPQTQGGGAGGGAG